jgi:N-acetylneuraminate synthase/N,N'-diacetyllegionaminate synthase
VTRFQHAFEIGGRRVGADAPVFVVAEAGVAHFGDMDLARQLVEVAKEAAADAFKIQLFDPDGLIARRLPAWRERLRPRNLTLDQARALKAMCDDAGLRFMATAHDESRIPWLAALDVAAVKIGSGERNNPSFVRALASLGKPVILSTGMHQEGDIREALDACGDAGCDRVALLHCVTMYPTPAADVNLAAMDRLREMFEGPVGYSDHTTDGLAVLAAVARGARVVEKHITILRDVPDAQDWKVSADRATFPPLVADIRRLETMLGDGRKRPAAGEADGMHWALKSVVAARDLPAGHRVTTHDVVAKRPGDGIPPNRLDLVVGRTLRRAYSADDPLQLADLE